MLPAIFGALASLGGIAAQSSAMGSQTALEWANLQFQKQKARDEMRFAKAGREDAYGNKQRFDDLANEWDIELTPMQAAIIRASEREQKLSLTEDAPRNRDIRKRAYERGLQADEQFDQEMLGYKYDGPESEEKIRSDLLGLIVGARGTGLSGGGATLARQALRLGRGADIPAILKADQDSKGGAAGLAEDMLKARQMALGESGQRQSQHSSRYLPALKTFSEMAMLGGDMPVRMSTLPQEMRGEQAQIAQMIMQAHQDEARNVGNAYHQTATAAGRSPDFSSLVSSLRGFNVGGGRGNSSAASRVRGDSDSLWG